MQQRYPDCYKADLWTVSFKADHNSINACSCRGSHITSFGALQQSTQSHKHSSEPAGM
jgi:hypothetical protein